MIKSKTNCLTYNFGGKIQNPNNTRVTFSFGHSLLFLLHRSLTQIQNQTLMHNFSFIFLFEILDWSRIWTLYSISLSFIFWKRLSSFFYFISLLMISKCIIDMYHNDIIYAVDSQNNKFIDFGIIKINSLPQFVCFFRAEPSRFTFKKTLYFVKENIL